MKLCQVLNYGVGLSIFAVGLATIGKIGSYFINASNERQKHEIQMQEPSGDKGAVISEGYKLRNKLYDFVDKDNNRILDRNEKRGLLDLLGFHDVFLDESSPVSVRPTKDGDGRLNIYFSEGFDGYVGTIPYTKAEEVFNSKKEEPKKKK